MSFIDINERKVEADAQDFKDAMANLANYANIVVNDYAALEDADVIISSLGNIQLQHNAGEDRFAEFPFTREAVYQVSQELKKLDFKGILLVISNPVDAVSALYQEFTGWPKERVIGTGTLLDTARMKAAVGEVLKLIPNQYQATILGTWQLSIYSMESG